MIDATQTKELIDILENVYDVTADTNDLIKTSRVRVKEAKEVMTDYAKKNELDPKIIKRLYNDYKAYREGNGWDDDDEYVEMLVKLQDMLKEDEA